jgi:hypothetical protein
MKLKQKLFLFGLLSLLIGCSGSQQSAQQTMQPTTDTDALLKYQNEITVDFLKKHLTVFASDSMEGRETGMPGQKKAAEYLVEQYKQLGLQPVGDNNSYYQKFNLDATISDSIVFETYSVDGEEKNLISRSVASQNSTAAYIRGFGGTDTLQGKIVFAGFGVNDKARNVTHLEGVDLNGKWVMVFQQIPNIVDGDTLINPKMNNRFRFQSIFSRGAEGLLIIPYDVSSQEFAEGAKNAQTGFGEPEQMSLSYLNQGGSSGGFNRGYNSINPAMAARILELKNGESGLDSLRQNIIENITEFQPKELSYSLSHIPYSTEVNIETENVLAFFEGADPELKDEIIVLTSHYDHLGIGQPDSTGDRIYNGADDDGSGTIGLLNIAKAFVDAAENGVKPKRSILILHVSGEEKGLLGSRFYSDHPVFPIDKTVTNINTDMIGRVDPLHQKKGVEDYSYIIGGDIISSELDSLISVANSRSGQLQLSDRYNDLQDPNQFYRRSDHWNFGRLGVPFVFFFTGVHEDYHQPSDEVHKIRFDKMAKIVRTIYATTVLVANTENPPIVDNQSFIEITKGN